MTTHRPAIERLVLAISASVALAGCAMTPMGPTVQVMPGPGKSFDQFQADNAMCKAFAADQVRGQADAANQRAVGAALLTTALGAGVGAAGGALGGNAGLGAGLGAGVGSVAGAAIGANTSQNGQMSIQGQYDAAFSQCMYAKGNQVPGFAPLAVAMPAPVAAAPPDPTVRATQAELIRLGYLRGAADGYSGPKTRGAISAYESASGLPVDGVASQRLLAALQATPGSAGPATSARAAANWGAPMDGPTGTAMGVPPSSAGWVAPTR